MITEKNENDRARLYIEEAKVLSETTGKIVQASALVKKDIRKYQKLKKSASDKNDTRRMSREIAALQATLKSLLPMKNSGYGSK